MRVKYSSLPEVRLEMIELTSSMSRWSLRLKSWSRVLLKVRESMWWSWRVAVEVEIESGLASVTVERDSDSSLGYEKVVYGAVMEFLIGFFFLSFFFFFFFLHIFLNSKIY